VPPPPPTRTPPPPPPPWGAEGAEKPREGAETPPGAEPKLREGDGAEKLRDGAPNPPVDGLEKLREGAPNPPVDGLEKPRDGAPKVCGLENPRWPATAGDPLERCCGVQYPSERGRGPGAEGPEGALVPGDAGRGAATPPPPVEGLPRHGLGVLGARKPLLGADTEPPGVAGRAGATPGNGWLGRGARVPVAPREGGSTACTRPGGGGVNPVTRGTGRPTARSTWGTGGPAYHRARP